VPKGGLFAIAQIMRRELLSVTIRGETVG